MKQLFALFLAIMVASSVCAQATKDRIIHNDPARYRELSAVHDGAGKMGFTQLIGRSELSTNFLYLHSGSIDPKSGIGHHFHHRIEEMYVILNGEAEFTVNGRTSKIKAPAIVPCKMGDAHGIFNPTGESLRWLNFAVSLDKGRGDAFDLGDTREGAELDPVPVFVSGQLTKDMARPNERLYSGEGVLSRRVLGSEVFSTSWDHVDHLIIPAGGSTNEKQLLGYEEVYYVINGSGSISIDNDQANFVSDDAFYAKLGETTTISNNGNEDLEILVIGIAVSKENMLSIAKPLVEPKATVLQMDFIVPKENVETFEKTYYSIYVPAMTVQQGYIGSKLLRLYPDDLSKEIEGEPTQFNYQIQISFDTEASRKKWVASEQHKIAWPATSSLSTEYKWRGYDVMGDDLQ